ncbi:MAG TPA: anti-sigma factor RsbA family regulatory protein [Acidimicrobiales bacterium]|nr:anti-sigma factor RsbA family regulatory protein [Acidimicrobiales bacterium]
MSALADHRSSCSFEHQAFIYDSDDDYLVAFVPLLETARGAGDDVRAVVPRRNAELLRSGLGGSLDDIEVVDAAAWYEHPVSTIAGYEAILDGLPPGTRAFVIGEVEFGSTEAEWVAWTRYEAALNAVLGRHNATVVCPYDSRTLPATVVEDARRTHPYLLTTTATRRSDAYVEPEILFRLLPPITSVPDTEPDVDLVVEADPRPARHAFAAAAARSGMADGRIHELVLALNEVLTNALVHGGGTARLRVWAPRGDELTCVVDDQGKGVDDVLLGYAGPPEGSAGGYGVWVARRLFERCELQSSPTGGLTVVLATRS